MSGSNGQGGGISAGGASQAASTFPGGGLGATDKDSAPKGLPKQTKAQAELLAKAKKQFERGSKWESNFRSRFIDDNKFAEADAYNGFQWPNSIRASRDTDQRPCLTINRTRQHNLQIINDAKQNTPGISVRPTGGGASYASAQVLESICRHIEYQSNATAIYNGATAFQVKGGYGVWRVATDYAGPDTLDQEIFLRGIPDPLSVLFDPDAKEPDKSDSRFAFVFDNLPRDVFKEMFPEFGDFVPSADLIGGDDWLTEDHVRVCEYFYVTAKSDKLVRYRDESGQEVQARASKIPKEVLDRVIDDPATRHRTIETPEVHYAFIVGDHIVEEKVWPGKYIPLVPLIGEETIIDGMMDRKGHTRALIDPQRMYNYWASAAVEFGALQSKTPWIAAAKAIEGFEEIWENSNRNNKAVLPFNHWDDDGATNIPPPQRPAAPEQAPLYLQGMQTTQMEMMMVSGQFQAQMGQQGNERTGKAIQERQRQGDNATYHFIDGLGIAIRHTGKILIDLIPKVYDTQRILHILAEDGTSEPIVVDPQLQQAYAQHVNEDKQVILKIFNPSMGTYDVEADIGPGYATKREEAANAMQQVLTQAPELTSLIGDILFSNMDFPGADDVAERLKRMVPPQALGTGPSQTEQQAMQKAQQLQGLLSKAMDELADTKMKLQGKSQMREIDAYKAETERSAAFMKAMPVDPEGLKSVVQQLIREMLGTPLTPVAQSAVQGMAGIAQGAGQGGAQPQGPGQGQGPAPGAGVAQPPPMAPQGPGAAQPQPPMLGARRAPDGAWYLPDPHRPGKYLRVVPRAQG